MDQLMAGEQFEVSERVLRVNPGELEPGQLSKIKMCLGYPNDKPWLLLKENTWQ